MYKLKKVYICNNCGKIQLPAIQCCGENVRRTIPEGWMELCGGHLCEKCHKAFAEAMATALDSTPPINKIGF